MSKKRSSEKSVNGHTGQVGKQSWSLWTISCCSFWFISGCTRLKRSKAIDLGSAKYKRTNAARTTYYSGKKKTHTLKNNVITERDGKVVFLSDTYDGKKHDKKIAEEEGYQFPSDSTLWQDTGFQGYAPEGVKIE